jgi:hypothetical protein
MYIKKYIDILSTIYILSIFFYYINQLRIFSSNHASNNGPKTVQKPRRRRHPLSLDGIMGIQSIYGDLRGSMNTIVIISYSYYEP